METIKNYLESMFASLPNTSEVRKAKAELLQMMEDKYNELIEEGESENAAVGTVISEFGNLEELSDDLGLKEELHETLERQASEDRRHVTLDEVKGFIDSRTKKALFLSLGIFLCIISVAGPIIFGSNGKAALGVGLMFTCITLGVGSIIYSSFAEHDFSFLKHELCMIDMSTASYVKEHRRSFESIRAICMTIGVMLCVACWVPCVFFGSSYGYVGASLLFFFVGFGVFLIVYGNTISKGYDKLLRVNDNNTISGTYSGKTEKEVRYKSKTAETIVQVYWPFVTSIYLIVSFLTFQWGITWIIWPIAGAAHKAVLINCQEDDE